MSAIPTLDLTREQWLAVRQTGIGSSDAAVACGLSPYKTPFRLYAEKRGEMLPDDLLDNERVQMGILLEPVIAVRYMQRTGRRVRKRNAVLRSEAYPYMLANIDREVIGENRGVECKAVDKDVARFGEEWGEPGSADVPTLYYLQCQHQMAVIPRWDVVDLAALVGGNDLRIYPIPRDEQAIEMLTRLEGAFWECVLNGTPPKPVSMDEVKQRWPRAVANPIEATPEVEAAVQRLREAKAWEAQAKAAAEAAQIVIAGHMGENDTLTLLGEPLLTWKLTQRDGYTVGPTEYRAMRLAKKKKGKTS